MDGNTYSFVRSILRSNVYDPGGPNSLEATNLYAGQQAAIYKRVSQAIAEYAVGASDADNIQVNSIKTFTDQLLAQAASTAVASVSYVERQSVLSAKIPVVTNASVEEVQAWLEQEKANPARGADDLSVAFAAGVLYEMGRFVKPQNNQVPIPVSVELASYAAWRALELAPLDATGATADKLTAIRSTAVTLMDDIRKQMAVAAAGIRKRTEGLTERANQAIEAAESAAKQAGEFDSQAKQLKERIDAFAVDIDAKTEDAETKLSGFLDAARARSTYQGIKIYWTDRANASWWALMVSGFVLFILLVVMPAIAVWENDTVITLLKHLTDAAGVDVGNQQNPIVLTVATVSRLVVITIPLALYFWLIKLVVRFNIRSMLLMDDARLRATIIETYYKMIEESAAMVEDRALILQALCRPAPGHGPDSIDPPNFTDVIEKAMGKG